MINRNQALGSRRYRLSEVTKNDTVNSRYIDITRSLANMAITEVIVIRVYPRSSLYQGVVNCQLDCQLAGSNALGLLDIVLQSVAL